MIFRIEDCVDCLVLLYPKFDDKFELNHSSSHHMKRPDSLSTTSGVTNKGWGRGQRMMRNTVLTVDSLGTIAHNQ